MCLYPKKILNPSTWIDPAKGQSLYIYVPCGHCSECIISYRNEWRNRAYYESLDCFLNGGYILFDTLTYRNGNLPHLRDWLDVPEKYNFPCFSYYDVSHFLALLRRRLSYRGYSVANKLRFFLACEYGDDIRYTRRPHYHLLLFVPSEIKPQILSTEIAHCWSHGRTDGVPYRGLNYVLNNNVFTSLVESERFAVNYVTKYCTKQFSYSDLVNKRIDALKRYSYPLSLQALDYVNLRHYQSKSFGHDALIRFVGRDNLLRSGTFRVIGKDGIFRHVSLHASLQRKLLYDYTRDSNGCVHWSLNHDGFDYKKRFWYRQVDFLTNRIAASSYGNYSEYRLQVINKLFFSDRFTIFSSPEEQIENSYNIDSGLRNYCCVDYSFMRRSIFTKRDFGSKKLGFHVGFTLSPDDYVPLSVLRKSVSFLDTSLYDNYVTSNRLKGDGALDVLKLIHRLQHVFKIFDYA